VEVESASAERDFSGERFDLSFFYDCNRYHVELKTANSNWRMPGVYNKTRPIKKNIAGIGNDARKLSHCSGQGIVAFVLFPIPPHDNRWTEYLDELLQNRESHYRSKATVGVYQWIWGPSELADLVVC